MKKSLKQNLVYQSFYRILSILTPLITSPYLARVLGAKSLGIYSYTLSVVSYFMIFAFLGTETYGNRTIARINICQNKELLSKNFWGIYILQLFCSIIAFGTYIFFVLFIEKENRIIAVIQGFWIISTLLDINWFFFGIEEVKLTVIRNSLVKLLGVFLILIYVKSPNDLFCYALIMVGTMVVSQLIMWAYIPKYIKFVDLKWNDIKIHIKPNIGLFIPLIASNLYWTMDKTMLGILSDYENTGYYYNADKVMNIPLNLIIGFGAVMLPRMSAMIEQNRRKEWNKMFSITAEFYMMASCAVGGGIAAIANEFVPFFFGDGYEPCVLLIKLFGPILVLKAINDMIKNQCILPLGEEKKYTLIVFCGAIVNIITNYILIPSFGALGALTATGISELIVVFMELILERKFLKIKNIIWKNIYYAFFAMIMYGTIQIISHRFNLECVNKLIIEILVGVCIYIICCFIYWKINPKKDLANYVNEYINNKRRI